LSILHSQSDYEGCPSTPYHRPSGAGIEEEKKLSVFFGTVVITLALWVAGFGQAEAAVVGKNVEYSAQGVVLKGFLAYDDKI
jgi:hypothetical protein